MGVHVARYQQAGEIRWGLVASDRLLPIDGTFATLAEFLGAGRQVALAMDTTSIERSLPIDSVRLLSPVTAPCTIVCQGLNYGDHRAEAGMAAKRPPYNLMFVKASSALSGPHDDVIRPHGVRLLDYELELGLVIGASIDRRTQITEETLSDYVAGIVISNDVSARDVQIPQQQWFKGKSYRTFCPTGPYLYLLDHGDTARLDDINIRLEVNGQMRQASNTAQLIFKPAETLTELSGLMDLHPGDLIQTGTPGGVAVKAPPAAVQRIARFLLAESKLMQVFVNKQLRNPNYLKDGDVMRLTMRSSDGTIDLGVMETQVKPEN